DRQGEEFLPSEFTLEQNFPNPFNNSTIFRFGAPEAGRITLTVYNIMGQKIYEMDSGEITAGWHQLEWGGVNQSGDLVASGIYFYRFSFKNDRGDMLFKTGKMHLIK
ncbi:MAG: FlgD immunoglobulin-like domain containing protein, partial [Calditrichia bacterium]